MNLCNTSDLRKLEIINLCDGARMGYAGDFLFDRNTACITALVIPGSGGFLGIGKRDDIVIPWRCIRCFGEDTILVDLPDGSCNPCYHAKKHVKKDKNCRYDEENRPSCL